jgi:hypothetical protein
VVTKANMVTAKLTDIAVVRKVTMVIKPNMITVVKMVMEGNMLTSAMVIHMVSQQFLT